jgi:5'(3')-deoxyribonucleotidase
MILVYNIYVIKRRADRKTATPKEKRKRKMARTVYYFDMDGVIANFHKEPFKYANATNREWIANLDPFMENVKIIRDLLANKKSVYILTKAISEEAKQGKLDWIARYIPELDTKRVIVIVGNGKKVDYMRTKTGILIDDDIKNTRPWEKAGHKAITLEYKGQAITL